MVAAALLYDVLGKRSRAGNLEMELATLMSSLAAVLWSPRRTHARARVYECRRHSADDMSAGTGIF